MFHIFMLYAAQEFPPHSENGRSTSHVAHFWITLPDKPMTIHVDFISRAQTDDESCDRFAYGIIQVPTLDLLEDESGIRKFIDGMIDALNATIKSGKPITLWNASRSGTPACKTLIQDILNLYRSAITFEFGPIPERFWE